MRTTLKHERIKVFTMDIKSTDIEAIVKKVISQLDTTTFSSSSNGEIPVGISNRHIHLAKADLETLFGVGYELTPAKERNPGSMRARKH